MAQDLDPNVTLEELRSMATEAIRAFDNDEEIASADAAELADAVLRLDEWLSHAGALPTAWKHDRE